MRRLFIAAATMLLALTGCQQASQPKVEPAIPSDPEIEKNVQAWIKKMTLDEKIGQMLELNLDLVGSVKVKGDYKIDRREASPRR